MKQIILPGTDIHVSRFSFGTASLFNVGSATQRARLLAAAYDCGFRHFDTAPYYGFGISERDLRGLLAARPDATVGTKVGLYSPGGENQQASLVYFRKIAGKLCPAFSRATVDWSVSRAKEMLSASLRRLGRDWIDLYMLHEADLHLLNTDEWLRWLENERNRVRRFGIAADSKRVVPFLESGNPFTSVIQINDSIRGREADSVLRAGRPLQITYGYVSSLRGTDTLDIRAVLKAALLRNRTGSIIVSTTKISRLSQYGAIVAESESVVEQTRPSDAAPGERR
jgi:D-threo-aldose 1-dehydrogenase